MEKIQNIESVLEQAFQFDAFGAQFQYQSFKYQEPVSPIDEHLISQDITGTVIYTDDRGTENRENLVIKTINEKCAYPFKHLAFLGEISIRRRIIPYLEKYSPGVSTHFAKFYFGSVSSTTDDDDALIILKNLEDCRPSQRFWDSHHLFVVMKSLAQFHAASYNAKHKDPNYFPPILRRLHEIDFSQNEVTEFSRELANLFPEQSCLKEFLRSILLKKIEPVSVICVGVMATPQTVFRYDTDGKPVDVKFAEFFGSRYSSPAFDLMNVMYLCVNRETRSKYWEEALQLYYDTLVEAVNDGKAPTFASIEQDFKAYSLIAYSVASVVLSPYFEDKLLNVILNDIEKCILSKNVEK